MSMFGNLKNDGLEETGDRLGGFTALETDAYTGEIKLAYAGKSNDANSKAQSVTLVLDFGGKEYRETFWMTNKNGENWYTRAETGTKKFPLAGYTHVNDICLVTLDKPISDVATEDKVVNIYDYEAKKELPKTVPMLTELLGKQVTLGIRKELSWQQKRNESSGNYEDTDKERIENVTDKVFHYPSNLTVSEAKASQPATFYDAWVKKNKGETRDKRKGTGAGGQGKNGAPPQASGGKPAQSSLFNGGNKA